jgi:hypothetical protein
VSVEFEVPLVEGDLDVRAWFDEKTDNSGLSTCLYVFYMYIDSRDWLNKSTCYVSLE